MPSPLRKFSVVLFAAFFALLNLWCACAAASPESNPAAKATTAHECCDESPSTPSPKRDSHPHDTTCHHCNPTVSSPSSSSVAPAPAAPLAVSHLFVLLPTRFVLPSDALVDYSDFQTHPPGFQSNTLLDLRCALTT